MPWGFHLLVDAGKCDSKSIRDPNHIKEFATSLVKRIKMVAVGNPEVIRYGKGKKLGYTLVQLIETSDITAQFVESSNDLYLDVFSCKEFDPKIVKDTVNEYFTPERIHSRFLHRQA